MAQKLPKPEECPPSIPEIMVLARALADDWKPLCRVLGVQDAEIKQIDHDESTLIEKSYKGLVKWLECSGTSATYSKLADGLKDERVQRNDLAEKYCSSLYSCAVNGDEYNVLPISYPYFVNRTEVCEEIKFLLGPESETKLVLIRGPPGMGKTSTAVKVANDLETQGDWKILYVNCRYILSLDVLAWQIARQLNRLPTDKPISEALQRLRCQTGKTLLVLDNFESLLHPEEETAGPPSAPMSSVGQPDTCSPREEDVKEFVSNMGTTAHNVGILITSREKVDFPDLAQKEICLLPLTEEDSAELLGLLGSKHDKEQTKMLFDVCEGLPLMLRTLAPIDPHLTGILGTSPPEERAKFLYEMKHLPKDKQIVECINKSFERLGPLLREVLVQLAVFKSLFTMSRAKHILNPTNELQMGGYLMRLINHSLLVQHEDSRLSLLSVIRDFCFKKVEEDSQLQQCFYSAKRLFIEHYTDLLEKLFKEFYTKESSQAIKTFRAEEVNIKQLLQWCSEDVSIDDKLMKRCVDTFNRVGELLAKMIQRKEFEIIFAKLAERCQGDKKRVAECWISLGIKIIFSCSCSPGLCLPAMEAARQYLLKAGRAQEKTKIAENSRAQYLAKLGRCHALAGKFEDAFVMVNEALAIRKAQADEDPVMLAATYNDLAVAQTFKGQHKEAMQTRLDCTLTVYNEVLGDHPFTATILNNMGNNYYALEKYSQSITVIERAFDMRERLLGDHQDTAKSLFDLGVAYKAQGDLEKARQNMQRAASMQEQVLDTPEELIKVYRELTKVLKELGREDEAKNEMEKLNKCEKEIQGNAVCCTSTDENWAFINRET